MSAGPRGGWAKLHGPLGDGVIFLLRAEGEEAMSSPFHFRFEILATRELRGDDLLDKPLALELSPNLEGETRFVHGKVRSLKTLGRRGGPEYYYAYSVELVPWIWFLSLHRDCRIFQNKSVKEIVEQVFGDRGFSDYRFSLTGQYVKRDFTVQFGESDLDFVSRLLEENGLFYFFEHTKSKHTLVIADNQGALAKNPVRAKVEYRRPGDAPLHHGVVTSFAVEESVHTGGLGLGDYFYEKPSADLHRDVTGNGIGGFYAYPGGYSDGGEGARLARVRLEAEEASRRKLLGEGTFVGLMAGHRFDLTDSESADGDYLIVATRIHTGLVESAAFEPATEERLVCQFEAIPHATPYRPPRRTPRPRLGPQTAVVVGPSGEEIYTDKYGRVKVHFHWDREGSKDEHSSCWIRVASTWAGNKWGAIQIPRIGQEVIVEFLDGDPDRPLITGSVYNAQQMPPWAAAPTQSGWKSHSSKRGGENSNELRFEDKKGAEEIYVRAEKDLTFEVVNDETSTVGNDRKVTVENDETLEVWNDRKRVVAADETVEVDGDQKITVSKGNRTVEVKSGDLITKAALGKIAYQATKSIELKVGANSIKIDPTGITLKGTMIKIEGKTMTTVKGKLVQVEGEILTQVKGKLVQVDGSAMLMAKGGISLIG